MIRKICSLTLSLFALAFAAGAQTPVGYSIVDSLVFTRMPVLDTTLVGRSIFSIMPDNVTVYQTDAVRTAVSARIAANDGANFNGYRIRIYFDNNQNARSASSAVLNRFKASHPDIPAYRTFDSPNFKVTVGDFRTRSEALAALKDIQAEYPSAFIIREKFKYPELPFSADEYRVDTLKVLRRF